MKLILSETTIIHMASFSIRRWIEGCEARLHISLVMCFGGVSVSADGSKGVKPFHNILLLCGDGRFSIRRWIEGCEARSGI